MLTLIDNHLVSYWSAKDGYLIAEARKGLPGNALETHGYYCAALSILQRYRQSPILCTFAHAQDLESVLIHPTRKYATIKCLYKYESVPYISNGAIGKDISGNVRTEYSDDDRITLQVAGRSSEDE